MHAALHVRALLLVSHCLQLQAAGLIDDQYPVPFLRLPILYINSNDSVVRTLQISSNLISRDSPEGVHSSYVFYVIYFYLADYLLQTAILLQMALWFDISTMVKYQQP